MVARRHLTNGSIIIKEYMIVIDGVLVTKNNDFLDIFWSDHKVS